MSTGVRRPTLPIRRWLALALVITFVIPVTVTGTIAARWVWGGSDNGGIEQRLREDADRWHDPAWQQATRDEFAPLGVDFVLTQDGQEFYRSVADPLAPAEPGRQHGWGGWWATPPGARLIQRLDIPGAGRTAYIYSDPNPSNGARYWILPLTGFTTLLLTLAGIAWLLGRKVIRPLAATSQAARQIAAGDLDIELLPSQVREVAEVQDAFTLMSAGLRESVRQQAQLEQERRLFIGAVAHDLRTPLFSLRGYLEGIEKGLADTPEKLARYVAVAQQQGATLERLIADLFDFTRLEYLDQTPVREPLDLCVLVQQLADGLQPRAEAAGISLSLDIPERPCTVDGDSHLLTRALENLLDNALRYTPAGGSVRVSCQSEDSGVRFSIADSGPGIPPEDLPHLFTPLYRGETSRNRRTGGAGLGLAIARRILQAHGGDLTAGNLPEGGAIFTGRLPATMGSRPVATPLAATRP